MTTNCPKTKEKISLSIKKKEDYESDIRNKRNLDQANDKYPLQL